MRFAAPALRLRFLAAALRLRMCASFCPGESTWNKVRLRVAEGVERLSGGSVVMTYSLPSMISMRWRDTYAPPPIGARERRFSVPLSAVRVRSAPSSLGPT